MALTDVKTMFDNADKSFNADAAKGMDAVFQFDITGEGGGSWHVTVKEESCRVQEGTHDNPSVTLKMSSKTWLAVVNQELNAVQAFMTGNLKVNGDIFLAQKIPDLFSF